MNFWANLSAAIFTGEKSWAWRRRMVFVGCAVFLAGCVHGVWFDPVLEHASMVLTNCITGFGATLAAYLGIATADEHLKRETERKSRYGYEDERTGDRPSDATRRQQEGSLSR